MKIVFETGGHQRAAGAGAAAAAPVTGRALTSPLAVAGGVVRPEHVREYREVMEFNARQARAYDAAITDDYNGDMPGTWGSANTEILGNAWKMRSRTRTLGKDDGHGKAGIRAIAHNVVGDDPFKLEMKVGKTDADGNFTEDEATNLAIEEWWTECGRSEFWSVSQDMSRAEWCLILEMSAVRDGGCLTRLHDDFPGNPDGAGVELLEIDRLPEWNNGKSVRGNPIMESIERHPKWKMPLFYHILTVHPGEYISNFTQNQAKKYFEEVPAGEVLYYGNLRTRAEQRVGVTELDAVVRPLWRNRQYSTSLTLAAIASNMKPFVLEKELPTGLELPAEFREQLANQGAPGGDYGGGTGAGGTGAGGVGEADPAKAQQGGYRQQTLKPGMERELPWGVKAKILDPKFPIETAHEFRLDNLRDAAQGLGVSYQDLSGDFQNLGFAAALMCQGPARLHYRIRQHHFVDLYRRLFRWRLKSAIMSGRLDLDVRRVEEFASEKVAHFAAHRWPFVNPLVQMQEIILGLEEKIYTPQQVQNMLPSGMSIEDLYREWDLAIKEAKKYGLNIQGEDPDLPRLDKGDAGQGTPNPLDEEGGQPPAKSKTSNPANKAARPSPARTGQYENNGRVHGRRAWRREETMRLIAAQGGGLN